MSETSLQLQARKIDDYRQLDASFENELAGVRFTVLPHVYPGGADSEMLCESIEIKTGDSVLDLCTGNGIVALYAALHGAGHVIGTDLNPAAIKNAQLNAKQLGVANVHFIETDLFPRMGSKFNTITINPPYTDHPAPDKTAICFWDEGNRVVKTFFKELREYLVPGGAAYISWSDFANQELLPGLARQYDYEMKHVGSKSGRSGFTYHAYQIKLLKNQ